MQFASTNRQLVPRARKQADANCASTGNWCQEQENKPMQIVQVQATGAKNKKTSRCKLCKYRQLVPRTRKQADANCASTGNWCQEQENKLMQIVQVQATGAKNKKTN